jgi:hypothetical protein
MILFIEKTWTLWWTFAVLAILYWFYKWPADAESEASNAAVFGDEARMVSVQAHARTMPPDPPFVDSTWF